MCCNEGFVGQLFLMGFAAYSVALHVRGYLPYVNIAVQFLSHIPG